MPKEPMESTRAAVAEIRRREPGIGKVKLHKVLYYVQGYHLTREGTPAFGDRIEAWEMGPVVASIWRAERDGARIELAGPPVESVSNVITYVICRLSDRWGSDLIRATHREAPWLDATDGGRTVNNQVLSHESLIEHFMSETDFLASETDDLETLRDSITAVRTDDPFVADPPGLREEILAEITNT